MGFGISIVEPSVSITRKVASVSIHYHDSTAVLSVGVQQYALFSPFRIEAIHSSNFCSWQSIVKLSVMYNTFMLFAGDDLFFCAFNY